MGFIDFAKYRCYIDTCVKISSKKTTLLGRAKATRKQDAHCNFPKKEMQQGDDGQNNFKLSPLQKKSNEKSLA